MILIEYAKRPRTLRQRRRGRFPSAARSAAQPAEQAVIADRLRARRSQDNLLILLVEALGFAAAACQSTAHAHRGVGLWARGSAIAGSLGHDGVRGMPGRSENAPPRGRQARRRGGDGRSRSMQDLPRADVLRWQAHSKAAVPRSALAPAVVKARASLIFWLSRRVDQVAVWVRMPGQAPFGQGIFAAGIYIGGRARLLPGGPSSKRARPACARG